MEKYILPIPVGVQDLHSRAVESVSMVYPDFLRRVWKLVDCCITRKVMLNNDGKAHEV
jgi:hypothetical protein